MDTPSTGNTVSPDDDLKVRAVAATPLGWHIARDPSAAWDCSSDAAIRTNNDNAPASGASSGGHFKESLSESCRARLAEASDVLALANGGNPGGLQRLQRSDTSAFLNGREWFRPLQRIQ